MLKHHLNLVIFCNHLSPKLHLKLPLSMLALASLLMALNPLGVFA